MCKVNYKTMQLRDAVKTRDEAIIKCAEFTAKGLESAYVFDQWSNDYEVWATPEVIA